MERKYYKGIPIQYDRKSLWLRVKFFWYKRIRKLDIVGFFDGIPIIRTKHLEDVVDDYTNRVLEDTLDLLRSEGVES